MKARDIIPGWPRGRSTSKPYELEPPPQMFGGADVGSVLDYSATETVFGVDHRWKQDWATKEIERRRKADMMEAWYMEQRISARGPFYPQPFSEKSGLFWYPNVDERVLVRYAELQAELKKQSERFSGCEIKPFSRIDFLAESYRWGWQR